MTFLKEELKNVKAFVFDVDGVLSNDILAISFNGTLIRTANVKDGFAIRNAVKMGYPVGIITGGVSNRTKLQYKQLGVKYYYQGARNKVMCFNDFLRKNKLEAKNVLFMGDDLVDYNVVFS